MINYKQQEFDNFADDYRDNLTECIKGLSEFDGNYFAEYKVKIAKDSLNKAIKNILDFGCGDGKSCEFFKKYFPDANITGVDISSKSIEIAKNKQIPNCNFVLYDGEKIPFDDNFFDLIFVAGVFHHIEQNEHLAIINELNRNLNNNGTLIIFEHNPLNPLTRKVVKDCIFDKNAKLISANSLKKCIIKCGFHNAKINYTLFFPRYNIFRKFFSLEKYLKKCSLGAQYYIAASKIN